MVFSKFEAISLNLKQKCPFFLILQSLLNDKLKISFIQCLYSILECFRYYPFEILAALILHTETNFSNFYK